MRYRPRAPAVTDNSEGPITALLVWGEFGIREIREAADNCHTRITTARWERMRFFLGIRTGG